MIASCYALQDTTKNHGQILSYMLEFLAESQFQPSKNHYRSIH